MLYGLSTAMLLYTLLSLPTGGASGGGQRGEDNRDRDSGDENDDEDESEQGEGADISEDEQLQGKQSTLPCVLHQILRPKTWQ